MSHFDLVELQRPGPEDVISPGDHDHLMFLDVDAEVKLRDVRRMFLEQLLSGTKNGLKPLDI